MPSSPDQRQPSPDSASARADLGGIEVLALLDAHGAFTGFRDAFPAAAPSLEETGRRRYPELFAGAAWLLPFRAFLAISDSATVLIDAGVGPPPGDFLPERQGWLPAQLEAAQVAQGEVTVVFLTHLHVDHVGWTAVDGRPAFENARYVTCADDWEFFAQREQSRATFASKLAPLEQAGVLDLVEPREIELVPGVVPFPTAGHTPGHMSVRITGADAGVCVLGDVAVHPLQIDEPGLAYREEIDAAEAAATRKRLLGQLAASGMLVAAGHFPQSFGRIAATGDRWQWQPIAADISS